MEIGRFRVLGELGRGAMGVVYRAQDPKIGRTLAIKSIRLNELTDPEERGRMRERLFREAQSAGILSHPNIVTIYDVSEEEGMAYIFMEFVNGMAFDDLLRASPPPSGALVLDLLTQTAAALDYAHQNGIIHRDIKPANIMVHEGRTAKVCDFGVAKIVSQQMTQAGLLMGTPSYMSPEQIEGRPMDGRSDQFALAVMVFDILTREKPFAGESLPILLYKICRADPPSASGLNTTLGIWVDPVLRKALAKSPDDRYPSCSAFITELRRALEERPGWMLPGKGYPGEDSTTGSGHQNSDSIPTDAFPIATAGVPYSSSSGGGIPTPPPQPHSQSGGGAPPFTPQSSNPAFARSTANPSVMAPPSPSPLPSAYQGHPVFQPSSTESAPTEAIRLPRPRVDQKRASPLVIIAIVALLGAGAYLAYQKFFEPAPVVDNSDPTKRDKKDSPTPDVPKTDVPKQAQVESPKPENTNPPEQPQKVLPPFTEPSTRDPKPNAAIGPYEVRFAGVPAGANVIIDGDSSNACKSPCAVRLPKGRHTMTATLDGYRSMQRSFDVSGEALVPIDLVETIGILVIKTSPPGATVLLNNQERPEKTPAELHIKPGTYQVVIVSPDGRRDSSSVTVKDGVPGTLNVNFP